MICRPTYRTAITGIGDYLNVTQGRLGKLPAGRRSFSRVICNRMSSEEGRAGSVPNSEGDNPLLTPYKLGPFQLSHRVVYAPLTRRRAFGGVPQPHMILYYAQRASPGGFMICEATCIDETAYGNPNVPGIHTKEQVESWKPVVQAVHDKGAIIFCQLWHVGRASHNEYQPNKAAPVSSTSVPIRGSQILLPDFSMADRVPARPLRTDEIPGIIESYRLAARNAIEAGFDGVEIHGANGYLLEQFMKGGVNDRTDEYGNQSLENRCRLTMEVVDAVVEEVGADRVGIRLSPFTTFNDVHDSDPAALGLYMARQMDERSPHIVYLHYIEPRVHGNYSVDDGSETTESCEPFRQAYSGHFIAAGGFTRESGNQAISSGKADLIAFGRMFISNPDLPRRFELNAPLTKYNRDTFYTPDPVLGYTDYPYLTDA